MKTNIRLVTEQPFSSDADYLDAEFSWLRYRVAVLEAKRDFDDIVASNSFPHPSFVGKTEQVQAKNAQYRLQEIEKEEKEFRKILDKRLSIHRQEGLFLLGLDKICGELNLDANERLVLLIITLPSVSVRRTQEVFNSLQIFGTSIPINEIIDIIGAEGTEEWLQCRKIFHVDSALVKNKLITLRYPSRTCNPADILSAEVNMTYKALSAICGCPELLFECERSDA